MEPTRAERKKAKKREPQFVSKCGYCGKPGRSKEHLWGRWSQKIVHDPTTTTHHVVRWASEDGKDFVEKKSSRPGAYRGLTLKVPCKHCNNGWMSKVIEEARPTLTKLAAGQWWNLDDQQRKAVACWAAMTTMTWEFADPKTQASLPPDRDHLMRQLAPPDHWRVFIGRYEGHEWTYRHNHKGFGLAKSREHFGPYRINAHVGLFTFGKLAICTLSHEIALGPAAEALISEAFPETIWPLEDRALPFHPPVFDDEAMERVAFGLEWANWGKSANAETNLGLAWPTYPVR